MFAQRREAACGGRYATRGACGKSPAGLRILIPGYTQWSWRQRERALVFFGSFAAALGVGMFAWGTRTGAAVLAFAFGAHVVSVVDVFKQSAFPGFGRWVPVISASAGLGIGIYAPAVAVATLVAWPGIRAAAPLDGYLVNCWAYRGAVPRRGDWIWLGPTADQPPRVGRIVAQAGQVVEWSRRQWWVDGQAVRLPASVAAPDRLRELAFAVPEDHVVIAAEAGSCSPGASTAQSLLLVPRDRILGRAWAKLYPLWSRRLLP
jgi:hypothetical protein